MSFSEFYQRSINEPEQFWAEQAGVLTGRRPLRKRSTTATRRLPVGFVKAEQLVSQRYRPLAGETARGAGIDCRLFGNRGRAYLYLPPTA